MAKSLKSATTVAQQVQLLRTRGMLVDEELAGRWLSNVSYYRLSAYWYPARKLAPGGVRADDFEEGTSFADVVALYEADRKLRTLVHDGMERVEVTMRTRIGERLCMVDPLSYADPTRFRPSFDYPKWMSTAGNRIKRAGKHNEAVKHYRSVYGGQYPFWVLAEVLDFADVSRLFEGLPARDQREIAEELGFAIDLTQLSPSQQRKAKSQSPLVDGWSNSPSSAIRAHIMAGCGTSPSHLHRRRHCARGENSHRFPRVRASAFSVPWSSCPASCASSLRERPGPTR